MLITLIDAGPIIAYFDQGDRWHKEISSFIDAFSGQFVTTTPVITEALWHLRSDYRVQNEFLLRVSRSLFRNEGLTYADFSRIAELNSQYRDLPADFADLSLIAVAERLDISSIVSIDREFDIYRRRIGHRQVAFQRIVPRLQ
jgi:hypothetical protein